MFTHILFFFKIKPKRSERLLKNWENFLSWECKISFAIIFYFCFWISKIGLMQVSDWLFCHSSCGLTSSLSFDEHLHILVLVRSQMFNWIEAQRLGGPFHDTPSDWETWYVVWNIVLLKDCTIWDLIFQNFIQRKMIDRI